jgi:2-phospho-L-lactate guanylyltransferase
MTTSFAALVPVKSPTLGKSRLLGVTDPHRRALAMAFALDTIDAARATPAVAEVVIVTSDAEVVAQVRRLGCTTVPDTGGLNASLRAAARRIDGFPVAVCADLPALDATTLGRALDAMDGSSAWFVADHLGVGTTTYAAPAALFDPRFGVGSRAAHLAAGAREVVADVERLRRDVDNLPDLEALADLGLLGPRSREAWAAAAPT